MKVLFVASGRAGEVGHVVKNQGESLTEAGIEVVYFLVHPGFTGYIMAIPRLRNATKGGQYDLVHAHYSLSAFTATLAGCRPLIVSLMGSDIFMSGIARVMIRGLHRRRWSATVVKTRQMAEVLKIKSAPVIPNGVDLDRFRPIPMDEARKQIGYPPDKKIVILISMPNRPVKNVELATEAVRELRDPNVEFRVVGCVPNEEIPYYLNAADVMILTSKWEGSANVIKEAMACNCPVVSTDVGDVRWVTGDVKGCYITLWAVENIRDAIRMALQFSGRTTGRQRIIRPRP